MPTNRRRRQAARRADVEASPRVRELLLSGHDFVGMDAAQLGPEGGMGDAELAGLWADLGDELTAEHVAEEPGTRPWGWWAFEAPEPRRQVGDGPEPAGAELFKGIPALHRGVPPEGMYESECEYLRRLGLLYPDEAAALGHL